MSLSNSFQVEVWKGDWELPSVNVDCLKILTYAKFNNISLSVIATNNPFKTPDGHLPVLKFENSTSHTVDEILDIFCKHNNSQNVISPLQKSETMAFHALLEECLYPALQYLWWIDQQNLNEIIRPWYCKALPFPFNFYYPGKYEKEAKFLFEVLYPTEEFENVETLVYTKAKQCITILSTRLGESDYFFGSIPTKFDALAFSYLAPLLKIPLPNCALQNHLKSYDNLISFITRILDLNFKKEQEYQKLKTKQEEKQKSSSEIDQKDTRRHQIYAGIFATIAMLGYALSTGIMQIQDDYKSTDEYYVYDNDMESGE